ncbi:MAG: M64 family metallopeptidase, partial [Bacteroidota bacterium]|nr:M64 family metallopeptidase [Bacteroidota bacterium]
RSISYCPIQDQDEGFELVVSHEAGGHGLAKLADEYINYSLSIPNDVYDHYHAMQEYGWYKNVDFTHSPEFVKWSRFLVDDRYADEDLGVYEGACTYAYGAWRPSRTSIMRSENTGYNAPSREAIYYTIHKLAYGDEWQYDYEEFVRFDKQSQAAGHAVVHHRTKKNPNTPERVPAPPVFMGEIR